MDKEIQDAIDEMRSIESFGQEELTKNLPERTRQEKFEQKFKELIEDEDNLKWFIDNYAPQLFAKHKTNSTASTVDS